MEEVLNKIKKAIEAEGVPNVSKIRELFTNFMKNHLKGMHIDNYIGDYPTFMEPVYLGNSVKIGDDVLIGPNVYIGDNCEIGDYVELSNTIIFKNAKLGTNVQLDNCIVGMDYIISKNSREKDKIIFSNIKYISPSNYFSF
jgi:NDP-sugar pyrophosphorylase family protein